MSLIRTVLRWFRSAGAAPALTPPPPAAAIPESSRPRPDLAPFKTTLLAKSSGGGWYPVTFTWKDGRLRLKCGCVAGKFSQFCKHKFELLDGNPAWLYDPAHQADLAPILALVPHTGFSPLLARYKQAVARGDAPALKAIKIQLKLAMRLGG